MFTVEVRDRGNSLVRVVDGLSFTVGAYSAAAVGGCEEAQISVSGQRTQLLGLLEWLGYPITIRNANGNAVWWGFVSAVDVSLGGLTVGLDVETVRNRVCVAYTERAADGSQVRGTTAWAEDAASQAQYGIHEERLSMGDITAAVATSRRDAYLAMRRTPARTVSVQGGGGTVGATLRCAGWWKTLEWRYWEQPVGLEQYAATGRTEHVLGFALTSTEFGFKTPSSLIDILGRLHVLTTGTRIIVYGSAMQDGVFTVKSAPRSPDDDAVAYTSNLIWFDPADDIFDVNNGLDAFKGGDMIKVTGATTSTNNRYYKVNTDGTEHIEVNPKVVSHDDAGPDVTIRRGHKLEVEETFFRSDYPGPSILVASLGTMVAQSFTPSVDTAWNAYEVVVQARRMGAPGDNLRVAIWSNSGGSPASSLASGTVAGVDLSEELEPVLVALSSPLALAYGTTYWLVVDRTGSAESENMYALGLDEGLRHSGALKVWNSDHWEARVADCDMPFEVWGKRETTQQVKDIAGYVLVGVAADTASGVYARQWRNGEQTVRQEAEELLAAGTSTGRRLLAQVSPERVGRIYAEPDAGGIDLQLGMDGRLRLALGAIDEGQLPAGQWVQLEADAQALGPLFIERAEYTPGTGYTVLEPRSSAPWEDWT